MKTTLTPIQQERLDDLRRLSNHGGRDQWHGLRCHHIRNGQFTATYADIAARWGVKPSVVYSTIKRFIKLGLIATQRFERATLFTLLQPSDQSDQSDQSDLSDSSDQYESTNLKHHNPTPPRPKIKKILLKRRKPRFKPRRR